MARSTVVKYKHKELRCDDRLLLYYGIVCNMAPYG